MKILPFLLFLLFLNIFGDGNEMEKLPDYWRLQGQLKLQQIINRKINTNSAKNVILFLGDGMSISTVTATRMLEGGSEQDLAFDKFPYFGLSKVSKLNCGIL